MNPSGSEFTLRVAICDLVERLKRMQHKCTYLEECRNQLVKEVIRLRLQNEWLAKQMNDSPEISSLPQNIVPQCYCNPPPPQLQQQQQSTNLVNASNNILHHDHSNAPEPNSNGDSQENRHDFGSDGGGGKHSQTKDESIHLINILNELDHEDLEKRQDSIRHLTIQILKDLDQEIKTGQLKSDLIDFVKNNYVETTTESLIKFDESPHKTAGDPVPNPVTDDYEAFNNNSDYYSNSHNLNVPLEAIQYSTQNAASAAVSGRKNKSKERKSPKRSADASAVVSNSGDPNNQKTASTLLPSTGSGVLPDPTANEPTTALNQQQMINILHSVNNDLKFLYQEVLNSTEKLNKIKSCQLRHFFQKQINLDNQPIVGKP